MFKIFSDIGKTVTSITGKVFGSKENREKFSAESDERSDKRLMKELSYRQDKLSSSMYTLLVIPFILMWLSFGLHPIVVEIPLPILQRVVLGYYKLVEAFGLNNLVIVVFQFLGISGIGVFKGIKMGKLTKELQAKTKVEEKKLIQQEKDRSLQIDTSFIQKLEGNKTTGYVLKGDIGKKSGVTIGMGVDLGYQSLSKYERALLKPDITEKLAPYFGVLGEAAHKLLKAMPLKLSEVDTLLLNEVTLKLYAKEVRSHFKGTLYTYPPEAQTIIMSRAWHGGTNLPRVAPKFYKYSLAKDWKKMRREILNYYKKDSSGNMPHQHRLKKEAEYLAKLI